MAKSSFIFTIVLLSFVLFSCKPSSPRGILSESKMEEVLYDYHLAQGMAEREYDGDVDKLRYQYVEAVFKKHHITEAEFDSSMIWYAAHSAKLQTIYVNICQRYETEMRSMGMGVSESEVFANMSEHGDTTNIWSGAKTIVLQNDYLNCLSTLTMKADSSFLPGDNYALHLRASFTSSQQNQAHAFLSVYYKDGTSKSGSVRITRSSDYKILLPDDISFNTRETDRIQITFYFEPDEGRNADHAFLSIESPILARFHRKHADEKPIEEHTTVSDSLKISSDTIRTDSIDNAVESAISTMDKVREGFNLDREQKVKRPLRNQGRVRRRLN